MKPVSGPTRSRVIRGGKKYDSGKPRLELIPGDVQLECGKVYSFGAEKYAPNNWALGISWLRQIGAAERHIQKWKQLEDLDPESGINHLAHAIVDLQMALAYQLRKQDRFDDRFRLKKGRHG